MAVSNPDPRVFRQWFLSEQRFNGVSGSTRPEKSSWPRPGRQCPEELLCVPLCHRVGHGLAPKYLPPAYSGTEKAADLVQSKDPAPRRKLTEIDLCRATRTCRGRRLVPSRSRGGEPALGRRGPLAVSHELQCRWRRKRPLKWLGCGKRDKSWGSDTLGHPVVFPEKLGAPKLSSTFS